MSFIERHSAFVRLLSIVSVGEKFRCEAGTCFGRSSLLVLGPESFVSVKTESDNLEKRDCNCHAYLKRVLASP